MNDNPADLDDIYELLLQIRDKIPTPEANQTKSESCASGCSPAGCGGDLSEAGRSPDRLSLSEVKHALGKAFDGEPFGVVESEDYRNGWWDCGKKLLGTLEELDKGEAVPESQDAMEEG